MVEYDPHMREVLNEILTGENYVVTAAGSGEDAIEVLKTVEFDLVITDLNMGRISGIGVLKKVKELNPYTMVVITTANSNVAYAIEALRLRADDYMLKPFDLSELLHRVSLCLEKESSSARHCNEHIKAVY